MSETPEIVERVAKSMYDGFQRAVGHNFGPRWTSIPFEEIDAQCQRYYRTAAREGLLTACEYLRRDGVSAIVSCSDRKPKKLPGERDTEFVKRITTGMLSAALGVSRAALPTPEDPTDA